MIKPLNETDIRTFFEYIDRKDSPEPAPEIDLKQEIADLKEALRMLSQEVATLRHDSDKLDYLKDW